MTPAAKRPPRPRCAICGKRFYDYDRTGVRLCGARSCRKEAFALGSVPAARPVSLMVQAFEAKEIGEGRLTRDVELFTRKTGERRRRVDPEVSALEKRRNFEAWTERQSPEYIKAMKSAANAKWRARKLLADPNYFNRQYHRLRSDDTLRKARERSRERDRDPVVKARRKERTAAVHRFLPIGGGPLCRCARCKALWFTGSDSAPAAFSTDGRTWTLEAAPCSGARRTT